MPLAQGELPPFPRDLARRGQSGGDGGASRFMPIFSPRKFGEPDWMPEDDPDQGNIYRVRQPAFLAETYSATNAWVNWTLAGPFRPVLRQDNVSIQRRMGNDSAFYLNPDGSGRGLHSTPRPNYRANIERLENVNYPDMQGRGINRLSNSRYHGQSYSQTTLQQR